MNKYIIQLSNDYHNNKIKFTVSTVFLVVLFALTLFAISYSISNISNSKLMDEQEKRGEILQNLVDVNFIPSDTIEKQTAKDSVNESISLVNEIKELEVRKQLLENNISGGIKKIDDLKAKNAKLLEEINKITENKDSELQILNKKPEENSNKISGVESKFNHDMALKNTNFLSNEELIKSQEIENARNNHTIPLLTLAIDHKRKTGKSLSAYKESRKFMLAKQYELNNFNIDYTLKKSILYMSLYNGLLVVILVFTAMLSIMIFVIGSNGWNKSSYAIKNTTLAIVVVLGMANLINQVIKPKENFTNYITKADDSERVQMSIIQFVNKYDKVNEMQIDSMIERNFKQIPKFTDILPFTDDKNISTSMFDFAKVGG